MQREVIVNGETIKTAAATLEQLLAERQLEGLRVATAVNGMFVAARLRTTTSLADGDHIEIVAARQGG